MQKFVTVEQPLCINCKHWVCDINRPLGVCSNPEVLRLAPFLAIECREMFGCVYGEPKP